MYRPLYTQECDQLRAMLNDLSTTLRKRGLHALQKVAELEEERDQAEEERDALLGVKVRAATLSLTRSRYFVLKTPINGSAGSLEL